jgi:hypothetical protein
MLLKSLVGEDKTMKPFHSQKFLITIFFELLTIFARSYIAFPVHKRYIIDSEKLNQQRLNCASQMREPLYLIQKYAEY